MKLNISELYIFKLHDVIFRMTCMCLQLKSLKSPLNNFSCAANWMQAPCITFHRGRESFVSCVIRAVLYTLKFSINTA